ncbi:Phosphotransferase enzyme family protein [Aspergillus niger]|uniref:Phosphotransferase enzyme family protein n=1 Tax=Aspergillus niger TaxID=5061 RepID=A0A505I9R4_ASPNG|nr:Phosphotransferase enzyme family protein [Aspergillus niger]
MAPRYALSSSEPESEAESASGRPADDALEQALRDAVTKVYKSGKMEELTVKRVRLAAEKALELEEGFYKTQGDWKTRSEQIIKDQVEEEEKATQEPVSDDQEDAASSASEDAKPAKRTRPEKPSASRKRQKKSASVSDGGDAANGSPDEEEDKVEKLPKKQTKAAPKKQPSPKASEDYVHDSDEEEVEKPKNAEETPKDDSESELSAEIKRLQGWLLKCGIRKMWARELAPYDTPKAKINHLKGMLKDAGMEGRYSVEKANRIREERELKADLEMVQEGAKRWGKESASENSDDGQPKRRLNRGRKSLAFLESEGEETD